MRFKDALQDHGHLFLLQQLQNAAPVPSRSVRVFGLFSDAILRRIMTPQFISRSARMQYMGEISPEEDRNEFAEIGCGRVVNPQPDKLHIMFR